MVQPLQYSLILWEIPWRGPGGATVHGGHTKSQIPQLKHTKYNGMASNMMLNEVLMLDNCLFLCYLYRIVVLFCHEAELT